MLPDFVARRLTSEGPLPRSSNVMLSISRRVPNVQLFHRAPMLDVEQHGGTLPTRIPTLTHRKDPAE